MPDMGHTLHLGDCLDVLRTLPDASVDAVVTDPPYGLSFMGKAWDHGVPGVPYWQAALRVLKPGGYLLAMGGTRTYHRLACAVEDAGFQIRDCLMWLYGSGFPKGKGCLKPAWEPILLARKPGPRVLPLGVDECRVPTDEDCARVPSPNVGSVTYAQDKYTKTMLRGGRGHDAGRYPANVVHDGGEEVLEAFAAFGEKTSGKQSAGGHVRNSDKTRNAYGAFEGQQCEGDVLYGDTGTAARFFYAAKASKRERGEGNSHPTVKPLALMRWLVRLVCPPGGTVLDPFMGSGTTGVACAQEGRSLVGIELSPEYLEIARQRIEAATNPEPDQPTLW
jgi:site-specific DNA-methyltransferase (adenine-specific)